MAFLTTIFHSVHRRAHLISPWHSHVHTSIIKTLADIRNFKIKQNASPSSPLPQQRTQRANNRQESTLRLPALRSSNAGVQPLDLVSLPSHHAIAAPWRRGYTRGYCGSPRHFLPDAHPRVLSALGLSLWSLAFVSSCVVYVLSLCFCLLLSLLLTLCMSYVLTWGVVIARVFCARVFMFGRGREYAAMRTSWESSPSCLIIERRDLGRLRIFPDRMRNT